MATAVAFERSREQRLLTAEEFLEWLEPGVFADLVGGEIFMHSPVNMRHARLLNVTDHLLRSYIEEEDLGELHREAVAVRLSARDVFMPDLAFYTKAQTARLLPTYVPFAPTFVIEALSPSTAIHDTRRKLAATEVHGLKQYRTL